MVPSVRWMILAALLAGVAVPAPAAPPSKKQPIPSAQQRIDKAVDDLIGLVDVYWHDGRYAEIADVYSVIVGLDPYNIEAWQNYGWILWSGLQRKDEAEGVFKRGISVNPASYELYFEMGNLEYNRRRFLSAAQWLAKATGRGAPWTVWHQRAHCLEYAGQYDKCRALWREIVRRFPDNPTSKLNLQRVVEGRFRKEPVIGVEQRPSPGDRHDHDSPVQPDATPPEPPVPPAPGTI